MDNMSFKTVSGEISGCAPELTVPRRVNAFPKILSGYKPEQIFKADKLALFFRL